jgi:hypothetical protein
MMIVMAELRVMFSSWSRDKLERAAIADRYRWLRDGCHRQVQRREQCERDEHAARRMVEERGAEANRWRQDRVAQSRVAIGALEVGMRATATVKGHHRDVTITKVGGSGVTVAFRLKSGAQRTALLYARDVQPA